MVGWLCPDCDEDACAVCGGAGELLLCDDCPRAWHLHCSVPVLDAVPEGAWTCAACRGEARAKPVALPIPTPALAAMPLECPRTRLRHLRRVPAVS